jgi:hypothetical protein
MKVYILKFDIYSSKHTSSKNVEVYSSEQSVKEKLEKLKEEFLANGPGFKISIKEDGRGFCGYHEMGSMSFVPGYWSYEEHELIS